MKLSSQFTVPATPEHVFPLLLDTDVMRSCLPGCEELIRVDETTFRGRMVNVVAHVRFNAAFSAHVRSIEAPHRVTALLKGEDNRIGSSIKIDAVLGVKPDDAGSLVDYEMDVALWGKIGRLGEAVVRRRTAEAESQFVQRFAAAAAAGDEGTPPAPAPAPTPTPQPSRPPADGGSTRSRTAPAWWQRVRAYVRRLLARRS